MQISFENSFEHWVSFQIFHTEQLKSLQQHTRKHAVKLVMWFVVIIVLINIIGYNPEDFNPVAFAIPLLIPIIAIIWLLRRNPFPRKMLLRQLTAAYKSDFENITDKRIMWDVSTEGIVVTQDKKLLQYSWENVKSITICPQYLIMHFGFIDYAYLPLQVIPQSGRPIFCEHLTRTYQEYAARHGKIANIVQSDWTIDLEALKKRASLKWSIKKISFTILWGIIFTIVSLISLLLIWLVVMIVLAVLQDFITFDEDAFVDVSATVCILGALLGGAVGSVLGLFEKLPGTKGKQE